MDIDSEVPPDVTPALFRQLSENSQQLLMRAFDELDKKETGKITKEEAIQFYTTFCNSETLSMTTAVLKKHAELMVKNFADQADDNEEISFEDWVNFFHKLEIDDETLEAILRDL